MQTARFVLLAVTTLLVTTAGSQTAWAQDRIPWAGDVNQALQTAATSHRLVLLHFWNHGCPPCAAMERHVFTRPEVIRTISTNFVPVKINVSEQPQLAQRFKIDRWPTEVILDAQGNEIHRGVPPANDPQRYTAALDTIVAHSRIGRAVPTNDHRTSWNPQDGTQFPADPHSPQRSHTQGMLNQAAYGVQTPPVSQGGNSGGPSATSNQFAESSRGPGSGGTGQFLPQFAGQPAAGSGAPNASPQTVDNRYFRAETPQNITQNPLPSAQSSGPGGWSGPATAATQPPYAQNVDARSADTQNFPLGPAGTSPHAAGRGTPPHHHETANVMNPHSAAGLPELPAIEPPAADPNGTPPMALDGFCPVTLVEQESWKPGNTQWGAIHRGRTYLFHSEAEQQRFLAAPDRYSPVLSGNDPVRFVDQQQMIPGQRKHGVFYNDRVYLFADEAALQRFWTRPDYYDRTVHQIMQQSGAR